MSEEMNIHQLESRVLFLFLYYFPTFNPRLIGHRLHDENSSPYLNVANIRIEPNVSINIYTFLLANEGALKFDSLLLDQCSTPEPPSQAISVVFDVEIILNK